MKKLVVILLLLLVVTGLVIAAGMLLLGDDTDGFGGGPTVVVWRVAGPLPETPQTDLFNLATSPGFLDLWRGLRAAAEDDDVVGLVVQIRSTGFGIAQAQELRREMRRFADTGKFVECYMESAGEGTNATNAYFLATACDAIHMSPAGDVNLLGLFSDAPFFGQTMEKLRIEPEVITAGAYKSAGESFSRSDHSPEAREALEAILDDFWSQVVGSIAEARGLETARVEELIDNAPWSAEEALEAGLLDSVSHPDEFRTRIEELAGEEPRLRRLSELGSGDVGSGSNRIAVLVAEGAIIRGRSAVDPWTGEMFVGSDDFTRQVRRLREDDSVDAVVLRVESPGGSALASDLMLRELELLAEEKPLIVTMSDVAASGGYYIAAKADKIVAEPGTITGSIGVVLLRLATAEFENELLGITHDPLSRGARAGLYTDTRPLDEERREVLQSSADRIYDMFIGHVADGRSMTPEAVDAVGQGRVWTGAAAIERGLVDELGGLDRAVELAREALGLEADDETQISFYPKPRGFFETLFDQPRPSLPVGARELLEAVAPRPRGALELRPDAAALTRAAGTGATLATD